MTTKSKLRIGASIVAFGIVGGFITADAKRDGDTGILVNTQIRQRMLKHGWQGGRSASLDVILGQLDSNVVLMKDNDWYIAAEIDATHCATGTQVYSDNPSDALGEYWVQTKGTRDSGPF